MANLYSNHEICFGYVGVGIVVLILVAIPQLQYRKHPDTYFLITEDYDAYLEKSTKIVSL